MIHSKKYLIVILFVLGINNIASAQEMKPEETEDWSRKPEQISYEGELQTPSDAIVLFSGESMEKWQGENRKGKVKWKVKDGAVQVVPGSGGVHSVDSFGSCQLHIEWKSPIEDVEEGRTGQGCGNSGVYFMGLYEVQILNSYENETYYNGQAGSVYKQHIPLVNASKKPEEWQVYDIVFTAPVFAGEGDSAKVISPAYFTVFHNGVLVQNHVELTGPTLYVGIPSYSWHPDKLPIFLQEHGNKVSYRNIWIRKL